jgi:hypothetical protein
MEAIFTAVIHNTLKMCRSCLYQYQVLKAVPQYTLLVCEGHHCLPDPVFFSVPDRYYQTTVAVPGTMFLFYVALNFYFSC